MNQNINFIPFARPSFSKEEEEAAANVIKSSWITTGAVTAEFEKKITELAQARYAMGVNSATSGLHLALEGLGIQRGDSILTTPYTFTSTAEVIRYMGAHPVFSDIEEDGFNISPEQIEKTFQTNSGKISAIIPVHVGGNLCEMEKIRPFAKNNNISIVEDCAHLQPEPLLEDNESILVYSFYATKCITTGEGGMIVTNNDKAAKRIKTMRFHGIDREAWDRYRSKTTNSWEYDVVAPGFKYNLPDILSAIGLVQLDKADEMLQKRRQIAKTYDESFSDCDFIKIPPANEKSSRHLYILRIVPEKLSITRDEFVNILMDSGIGISVHYKPLHLMSYYKNKYGLKPEDYPNSLERFQQSFSLPIYPDLTEEEISVIIRTVKMTGEKFRRFPDARGI
ncbi:MAG: DegT/DnrJ/EryC1/StrS family aminotransferase [Spirochaetales bacterium]|nr:DegT/DnrJ/EryC1/StrS family aminotransferase [Spirochaetales bacterium]